MSDFSPARREAVARRAGYRCEYCHLPKRIQVATFPLDHIDPKSNAGRNELENLALACPHCNAHKWAATDGIDSENGQQSRLYNPRGDTWSDHFRWNTSDPAYLEGITAIGRATIERLHMNDDLMIEIRNDLLELGILNAPITSKAES